MLIHLKNRFVRLTSLKTFENSIDYLMSVLVNSSSNKPKENYSTLFKQIYVDEIDFDALTVEKLIDLVFTEMVYRKIQQLEEETLAKPDQTDGNQWTRFRECFKMLHNEERWISYAERALELLNHDVMWRAVVEACKILKYPEPSAIHRDYFEALFDMSCFVWFQIYSESERTAFINNLIDYVLCVCKLKYNYTV